MHIKTQIKYADILRVMSSFTDVKSTSLLSSEVHIDQQKDHTTFWGTNGHALARLKIEKPEYFNFPLTDSELVSVDILKKLNDIYDSNISKRENKNVNNYKMVNIKYFEIASRAFRKINNIMGVRNPNLSVDLYFQNESDAFHLERISNVPIFKLTVLIMPVRK